MDLDKNYHVTEIYGIQKSFMGFTDSEWIPLNKKVVNSIHH